MDKEKFKVAAKLARKWFAGEAYTYDPIRNRDFQAWRSKFKRGGDIMVYSTPKKIKLGKPITIDMERICIDRE